MDLTQITFAAIIGVLTVIVGILVKMLGFPDQFRINYKRKSTKGLSKVFYALALLSYCLWTLHGLLQGDWVLVIGQGVGVLTTAMIVIQIIIYRKNTKSKK